MENITVDVYKYSADDASYVLPDKTERQCKDFPPGWICDNQVDESKEGRDDCDIGRDELYCDYTVFILLLNVLCIKYI